MPDAGVAHRTRGARSSLTGARRRAGDGATDRHVWLLQTLHEVTAAIARYDDIEASLQDVADDIFGRFKFTSVAIGVVDGDDLVFRGLAATSPPLRLLLPLTLGVTGRVARTGQGLLVSDAAHDPDYLADYVVVNPVASESCVPIMVDERVYGVLNVEADASVPLGQIEHDVLTTLAAALGLAIERSRRRALEQRRSAQLANLQHLTARIVGRAHVAGGVAGILDETFERLDFFAITVGLIRGDELHLHRRYRSAPADVEPFAIKPYTAGVTARVIRSGQPALIRDVRHDPDYFAVVESVTQEICVPIRVEGRVAGILDFEMDASRELDDSDFDVARMLADHLGIALEQQARFEAVERRNQQLRTLERITALIASKALVRESFQEIVREIERAFEFGVAGLGLLEDDRIVFHAIEQRLSGDPANFRANGVAVSTGVIGRVVRSGLPAFVPDVRIDPDYLATSAQARSEICVPITNDGRVVGVINVETPESRPIEAGDLEVLTIIASHIGIALARSDLYAAELRSRRDVEGMQRVSRIVASTLDPGEALRRIVATLAEVFTYPIVSFLLIEGDVLIPAASHGVESDVFDHTFRVGEHIVGRVAATGQAVFISDVDSEPGYLAPRPDARGEICVPIYCGDILTGVLNVEGTQMRRLDEHDLHLLQTFAEHAGTLLNNARLYEQMRLLATHDPITGLANRRAFQEHLQAELRRAQRYVRPLALLIIDVDRFKAVNDEFGHPAGDAVLREIGGRLQASLRETDLLARFAGDEFAALLPETTLAHAEETAQRLREAVSALPFAVSALVDLSIGVACYPDDALDEEALVDTADRRMYQDKRRRVRP